MRSGDVVKHGPSGEKWVLAYADEQRGEVSACGWPESIAKLADCTLVESCADEEHEKMLRTWAELDPRRDHGGDDHRVGVCKRQLAALEARKAGAT